MARYTWKAMAEIKLRDPLSSLKTALGSFSFHPSHLLRLQAAGFRPRVFGDLF